MRTLVLLASFAFVWSVAQGTIGYGRTRTIQKPMIQHKKPMIGHKPAIMPKPVKPMMDPMMGGVAALGGSMMGGSGLPLEIQNIIGKTISGKDIIGGQGQFPVHGGAGRGEDFANGLRNGWGGDGGAPMISAVTSWEDPLGGVPFDPEFNGGELIFDSNRGMYVAAKAQHHAVKKTGGMIGSPVAEHNIVKEANHVARKTVSGIGIAKPIFDKRVGGGSFIGLSQLGGMGPVGTAFVDPAGPIALDHQMRKSSGMGPAGHNIAKATSGIGMPNMQHDIAKATMLDVDPFGNVQHAMAKSSGMAMGGAGMGSIQHGIAKSSVMGGAGMSMGGMQHDIAKSSVMRGAGMGMGIGGIQHDIAKSSGMGGAGMGGIQHDIAKSSVMGGAGMGMSMGGMQHDIAKATSMAGDPFGVSGGAIGAMEHNMVKASGGMGPGGMMGGPGLPPVQMKKAGGNPAHNVEKVIRSGIASIGHDGLSFEIGSQIARQLTHNSAKTIDRGSGGAVSMGDPIANRAVHGLVKESLHIASETVDLASGKPRPVGIAAHGGAGMMVGGEGAMLGGAGMGMVPNIHGMVQPMMPGKHVLPKKPKVPKFMGGRGYGRMPGRRRKNMMGNGKGLGHGLRKAPDMHTW